MVDDRPDTFVARLAEVILYAFARGVDVEGTHHLAGGRPPVPDFT